MNPTTTEGLVPEDIVRLGIEAIEAAAAETPAPQRGRPPAFSDAMLAIFILLAVLKRRLTKSAQYRYLLSRREQLMQQFGGANWPSRATYFRRYLQAWELLQLAIKHQGDQAVCEHLADPAVVAVDQSLLPAQGPRWNKKQVARGRIPRAADLEARWGYSKHDGWVLGYEYEVVVTAGKTGVVWPLRASVGTASEHPCHSFPEKIAGLPQGVQYVLADAGYDSNAFADQVENTPAGTRRYLCPQINRRGSRQPSGKTHRRSTARQASERRRRERRAFFESPAGRQLFRRRSASVEPFNDWLKSKFHLQHRVWHRRLNNNRTQLLAAIFAYQLLLVFNHLQGRANGQIQWILDAL